MLLAYARTVRCTFPGAARYACLLRNEAATAMLQATKQPHFPCNIYVLGKQRAYENPRNARTRKLARFYQKVLPTGTVMLISSLSQ